MLSLLATNHLFFPLYSFMGSSFSKSKHSFFKPIKIRQTKGVASRDLPLKPRAAKATNFFAQKETPSIAKRNRRRNNKNASVNMKNKKKKKISKSLIGKPTNFQHTTHIGAGEVRSGQLDVSTPREWLHEFGCRINIEHSLFRLRNSNLKCWILLPP